MLPVEEGRGEGGQLPDGLVVLCRPVKRLLEGLPPRVGVILRVHTVGDHEELHEMEQALRTPVTVLLVTLDLVKGLLHFQPAPLQLDLHQWKAVDQDRLVVAVLVTALEGDLLRHLVAVPQWIHRIEKLQVNRLPVLLRQLHAVPQDLGFGKDAGASAQVVQHLGELARRQRHAVEGFQLRLQVRQHRYLIRHRHQRVTLADELGDQIVFKNLFGLIGHGVKRG